MIDPFACALSDTPAAPLHQRYRPMQIRIVEDARPGHAAAGGQWIAMEGKIEQGTAAAFARVMRGLGHRRLPIFIDSGGGSVADAMAIGRTIRARHLDVAVTETIFDDCATSAATCSGGSRGHGGRPNPVGSICASACVLVLAAGDRRGVAPWARVGVHRMVNNETLVWKRRLFRVWTRMVRGVPVEVDRQVVGERQVSVEHRTVAAPQRLYDQVGTYLEGMGMKPVLLSLMEATPASAIHMLTRDEIAATAIATDTADGESLLRSAETRGSPLEGHGWAPGYAFVIGPGVGHTTAQLARVTWSLARTPTPYDAPASLRADVELAGSTSVFSLRLLPQAGKATLTADLSFTAALQSNEAIDHVVPLAKRAFATATRTDLSGPAKPLVGSLYRAVVSDAADITKPLPSGDAAWISARAVTSFGRILDVIFEPPPPALFKEARATWRVSAKSAQGEPSAGH